MVGADFRTKKTWEGTREDIQKDEEGKPDLLTCLSHVGYRLTRQLLSCALEVLRSHIRNLGIHDSDSN
jgi:hypothetical protein